MPLLRWSETTSEPAGLDERGEAEEWEGGGKVLTNWSRRYLASVAIPGTNQYALEVVNCLEIGVS